MCYNCGVVPQVFYGCVSGNVRDYCYFFGKEVGTFGLLGIHFLICSLIVGISLFIYAKIKIKKLRKEKK